MRESLHAVLSLSCLNRKLIHGVVEQVVTQPERFTELHELTCSPDPKTARHAWWACEKLSYQCPEYFLEKQHEMKRLAMETPHEGIRRSILNILLYLPCEIPQKETEENEEMDLLFLNFCLDGMFDPKYPPAVQAVFIKLAYGRCIQEPELRQEFRALLDYAELQFYSPAVVSTVRAVQKAEQRYADSERRLRTEKKPNRSRKTTPLIFKKQKHV